MQGRSIHALIPSWSVGDRKEFEISRLIDPPGSEGTFILDGDSRTYETFRPVGFVGLRTLYVYPQPSGGVSIDNIVVPEPATVALIAITLLGSTLRRP